MTDNLGPLQLRFRPTGLGLSFLLLPPVLLLPGGLSAAGPPKLLLCLGPPALVLLSALLLMISLPGLVRSGRLAGGSFSALPAFLEPGEIVQLAVDPPRPGFHPGVRLDVAWRLSFGPLVRTLSIPLSARGHCSGAILIDRRGLWRGRAMLRASDTFQFFVLEMRDRQIREMAVPPPNAELEGLPRSGRLIRENTSVPRPKEDAEELLERRDYRPGDDPRRLDWKQLARTGELMVRTGDESQPVRGRVWIDIRSADPAAGTGSGRRAALPAKRIFRSLLRRRAVRLLDQSMMSGRALIRRFGESGLEVLLRVPGESEWSSVWRRPTSPGFDTGDPGADAGAEHRMAASLPAVTGPSLPPGGEYLWIVAHPADRDAFGTAAAARDAGCRVVLAFASRQKPGLRTQNDSARTLFPEAGGSAASESTGSGASGWAGRLGDRVGQMILDRAIRRGTEEGFDVRIL